MALNSESSRRKQFALIPFSSVEALADCSRAEILTYNALALHADADTGHCWPGRARLAAITHLNESRISKATSGLERKGLIRKQVVSGVRVEYYLLPQPPRSMAAPVPDRLSLPELEPTPVQNGTPPLTETEPKQISELTKEQGETAEPAPVVEVVVVPEPAPALSPVALRHAKTPPPDGLPESWVQQGRLLRGDLDEATIRRSGENFLDHHRARDSRLTDWAAEWRIWLRRERAPKATEKTCTASNQASASSPYQGWGNGIAPACRRTETPEETAAKFAAAMQRLGATQGEGGVWTPPNFNPVPRDAPAPTAPVAAAVRPHATRSQNELRRLAALAAAGASVREVTKGDRMGR